VGTNRWIGIDWSIFKASLVDHQTFQTPPTQQTRRCMATSSVPLFSSVNTVLIQHYYKKKWEKGRWEALLLTPSHHSDWCCVPNNWELGNLRILTSVLSRLQGTRCNWEKSFWIVIPTHSESGNSPSTRAQLPSPLGASPLSTRGQLRARLMVSDSPPPVIFLFLHCIECPWAVFLFL
jgi:hypothetical protein